MNWTLGNKFQCNLNQNTTIFHTKNNIWKCLQIGGHFISECFNSLWPSDIWWHRSGSTLAQVIACCLMAPGHYLIQSWLIISDVLWHLPNGTGNADRSVKNIDLTHWGRVTHICINKLTIIGSDNGLMPGRRQAIIWTNDRLLLIGPLGTNFSEILMEILTFSFKQMLLKVLSAKRQPFCLGLNVLRSPRGQWVNSYLVREVNPSLPGQNGHHLADNIFKCISLDENVWI